MALLWAFQKLYFYPRPPRGGRRHLCRRGAGPGKISIHALREEGDVSVFVPADMLHPISIHALREEGDSGCCTSSSSPTDFYPRPPRGGRLLYELDGFTEYTISIHALREEGD